MLRLPSFIALIFGCALAAGCTADGRPVTLLDSPASALPDNRVMVMPDPAAKGKLVAKPRPCADWQHHDYEGLENQFDPQFNCAQMYDLGLMVAEPGDLLQGRPPSAPETNASVLGIERYRTDKKKDLINPKDISATGGTSQ